jgi:ribokinase
MTNTSFDVYGLGQCAWDYLGPIDVYPPADSKCEMPDLIMQGGGPVATALVALRRWGFTCTFSGVIGDDYFGNQILSALKNEEVNTDGVLIRHGCASQVAFIAAEKNNGRRTIFWRRPTGSPVLPDEIDLKRIHNSRIVHTDGLFPDASIAAAKIARAVGIPVVVDAGTLREGMKELAKYSDYYIASQTFARALIGKDNARAACEKIREFGPEVAGVTLGNRGYVLLAQETWIEGEAYKVETVDTTGCGDLFHAGITFGVLKGWNIQKTADFSAWAAAQVSTRMGGRAGIPDTNDYTSQF